MAAKHGGARPGAGRKPGKVGAAMGRAQQRATDTAGRLKAISSKRGSDDEVDRMDAGARRRELDDWMRDKPKR